MKCYIVKIVVHIEVAYHRFKYHSPHHLHKEKEYKRYGDIKSFVVGLIVFINKGDFFSIVPK